MRTVLLLLTLILVGTLLVAIADANRFQRDDPQTTMVGAQATLALTFAHADHIGEPCTACHHEFLDRSGSGQCFDCHLTHPDVAALVEAQFHGLCRDCHSERRSAGEESGPVRRCSACHSADEAP